MSLTERDQNRQLTLQSAILEMIALRGDLDEILAKLCELVEELVPESVTSLMLIDPTTDRLSVRSAPGMPEETRKCFDGLALSPHSGSCGTAAYTGEIVIVENTLTDPRWAGLRDVARKINKIACWSIPVLDADRIVGTFAISRSRAGAPSDAELETLKTAAYLAGIALGRDRVDRELRDAERALRHAQKLESLGVLAGGIAHDFNNLLTGVLGNAELLAAHVSPRDERQRAQVDRITQAAHRAAELINQLLVYSGRAEGTREVVFLPDVVRDVAALLACSISKKATIRFEIAPDVPNVEGNITEMRQLVMNVITNASEALGGHGGEITVRMRPLARSDVPVSAGLADNGSATDRYLCLTVRDTGHGMDEETRSKIFDPFFSTKFSGHGLGLSAVHGIVKAQGGAIDVQSAVGLGTTFSVFIPATDKPLVPSLEDESVAWTGTATVLLVDDEECVLDLATEVLERANLTVIRAKDGQEALDVFRERCDEIDVVVLDFTMPKLNGLEVCERLSAIREDVRIVLSSGFVEEDSTLELGKRHLAGFIHKPYRPSELLRVVRDNLP